jgi:hypothetical protein
LVGTALFAAVLLAYGASISPAGLTPHHDAAAGRAPPVQIPVRVATLDPSTGAVIWSSSPLTRRIEVNPATGSIAASDQAVPTHLGRRWILAPHHGS